MTTPTRPIEHLAAGPVQHAAGRLVGIARGPAAAARAGEDLDRRDAQRPVGEPAHDAAGAVLGVVLAALGTVADGGAHEPPEGVAGQADGHQDQQHLAERLARDGVERALLVGRLAAVAERQLDGQEPDDPVDDAAGDQPGAGQPLELRPPRHPLALRLRLADGRPSCARALHLTLPRRDAAGRRGAARPARRRPRTP